MRRAGRRALLLAALLCAAAAGADQTPPALERATAPAAIPRPPPALPEKGDEQPGSHQGGRGATNVGWSYPGAPRDGFDAMAITLSPRIDKSAAANFIYWAFDGVFMDGQTWYAGLQPLGEKGKTALFSVFGPGTAPRGEACRSGADGGQGTHCHIHYEWQLGRSYQLTVTLAAAGPQSATWEGAVINLASGARTVIGAIEVPAARGYLKPWSATFSEFFHRTVPCAQQPHSEALFLRPAGYRAGREVPGVVHSLNANSGCNPGFFSRGSAGADHAYIDVGSTD